MFVFNRSVIPVKKSLHLFSNLFYFNVCNRFISDSHVRSHSVVSNFKCLCSFKRNELKSVFIFPSTVISQNIRTNQTLAIAKAAALVTSSPSSKKRQIRRKSLDDVAQSKYKSVFAFATADEYNMERLKDDFAKNSSYKPTEIDEFKRLNILHVKSEPVNGDLKEMYFFDGSIVFWNVPEDECFSILNFIKKYELNSYSESIVRNEQEIMPYIYGEEGKQSDLVDGLISLASDKGEIQSILDKYSFSNAMIMSVKLGIWECVLECYIAHVQLLTEDLKLGRKIRISSKEVLKKTGELFALRHAVNLSSDALDVPDFYWDLETQEKIYITMCKYFSINRRTTVVNEKINHCLELLELLSSQLTDKHHVRLEWMIIILITVEVLVALIHEVT